MKNKHQNIKNDSTITIYFLIAGLVITILTGAYYFLEISINKEFSKKDYELMAFIGSYFGGILNPAFALLALGALLWSIKIQSTELRETSNTLKIQNFEATFFQMLRLYKEVVETIVIVEIGRNDPQFKYKGREGIENLFYIFRKTYLDPDHIRVSKIEESKEDIYKFFYNDYGHQIGHYYRIVYNILKFIGESDWDYEEQKFYTDILRAQLSKYELALFFYNVMYFKGEGQGKMRPWVEKYNLFKHIEKEGTLTESDYPNLDQINEAYKIHRFKISNK